MVYLHPHGFMMANGCPSAHLEGFRRFLVPLEEGQSDIIMFCSARSHSQNGALYHKAKMTCHDLPRKCYRIPLDLSSTPRLGFHGDKSMDGISATFAKLESRGPTLGMSKN